MKQTYTLNRAAIAAHLCIAPKTDIRRYLNGVFLDTSTGRLVSTDGSCMLITGHQELKRDAPTVILPRDALVAALKLCPKKADSFEIDAEPATDDNGAHLTIRPAPGTATQCRAYDARYPDYARVVPLKVDNVAGNYDPALVATVGAALQTLEGRKTQQQVRLYQNGPNNAAWARLDGGNVPHLAVIMPVRTHNDAPLADVCAQVAAFMGGGA